MCCTYRLTSDGFPNARANIDVSQTKGQVGACGDGVPGALPPVACQGVDRGGTEAVGCDEQCSATQRGRNRPPLSEVCGWAPRSLRAEWGRWLSASCLGSWTWDEEGGGRYASGTMLQASSPCPAPAPPAHDGHQPSHVDSVTTGRLPRDWCSLCQVFRLLKQNKTKQKPASAQRAERGVRKGVWERVPAEHSPSPRNPGPAARESRPGPSSGVLRARGDTRPAGSPAAGFSPSELPWPEGLPHYHPPSWPFSAPGSPVPLHPLSPAQGVVVLTAQ